MKIYAPKDGFDGIYGSSLPSSFYRKDNALPPEMRYYGGMPPEIMNFGTAPTFRRAAPPAASAGKNLLRAAILTRPR